MCIRDRNSIVTGSNASGKSTFIKAVTVNCILAQTIHTCMAGIAEIPHAYVATSMAVKDSLMEGESYYMKEIRSLNRMLGYMQENELVVCAIEDVYKRQAIVSVNGQNVAVTFNSSVEIVKIN